MGVYAQCGRTGESCSVFLLQLRLRRSPAPRICPGLARAKGQQLHSRRAQGHASQCPRDQRICCQRGDLRSARANEPEQRGVRTYSKRIRNRESHSSTFAGCPPAQGRRITCELRVQATSNPRLLDCPHQRQPRDRRNRRDRYRRRTVKRWAFGPRLSGFDRSHGRHAGTPARHTASS